MKRPTNEMPGSLEPSSSGASQGGFTLVEMLISLLVLTFGLLAVGQLLYVAMSSASLARSKGAAALAAQDRLDFLADLFRQNPAAADLTNGDHGPVQAEVRNPSDANTILNRFNVTWSVSTVADPRAGKVLSAKTVTVTARPITTGGAVNNRVRLNKVVSVTGIFSPRIQ